MVSRPGPQPTSSTAIPGWRSKRSTMTTVGFREGIVQLDQPAQPCRAGDRTASGRDAPYHRDESDDAEQDKKEVSKRCHLSPSCRSEFRAHSAFAPENFTTLAHFSVSSAMKAPNSAGAPVSIIPPSSLSLGLSLGSVRPALISLLSLSMISAGVFFGAPTPYQVLAS